MTQEWREAMRQARAQADFTKIRRSVIGVRTMSGRWTYMVVVAGSRMERLLREIQGPK